MENKSKLSWNSFEYKFGSWAEKIKPFFFSGGFDSIYEKLKFEAKRGKKILPNSEVTFRAFEECPFEDLKCVICGISPYHTMKDGQPIADGIALSCSLTKYPQPTLDQWFNACERELNNGLCLPCVKNPDLKYLANQGVLMLNAGLTCEYLKPCSHNSIWEPFMQYLFEKVVDVAGVPILLLGREAQKLEKYINPFTQIFKLSHPVSAAYNNTDWETGETFRQISTIIKYRNNFVINWFDSDEELIPF